MSERALFARARRLQHVLWDARVKPERPIPGETTLDDVLLLEEQAHEAGLEELR